MNFEKTISMVGLDWGTTHRRAYGLGSDGACVSEHVDSDGALACKGRFPAALAAALQHLQAEPELIVMSGMVGSALGWQEVPYVDGQVPLDALPQHLVALRGAAQSPACMIIPGYCIRDWRGQPDVMRGEETQLLGALALGHHSGWFVLPGTHSKWVEIKDGRILQLRTYMTGELFNLLSSHGTLAAAATNASGAIWDDSAFAAGVAAAEHGALSHQLFACRARVVSGDMAAGSAKAYLSGLLIGSELHDVLRDRAGAGKVSSFKLIGSVELAAHYQRAAAQLGLTFEILDAKAAFIAALAHIQSHWKRS